MDARRPALMVLCLLLLMAPQTVGQDPCRYCFEPEASGQGGLYGDAPPIRYPNREWRTFADLWTFESLDLDLERGTLRAVVGTGPGAAPRGGQCESKGPNEGWPSFYGPGGRATLQGTFAPDTLDLQATFEGTAEYLCNDGVLLLSSAFAGTFTGTLGSKQGLTHSAGCAKGAELEDGPRDTALALCWDGTLRITWSKFDTPRTPDEYDVHKPGDTVEGNSSLWIPGQFRPAGEAPTTKPTVTRPVCAAKDVAGSFEPVQAVFQDDEVFPDRPGKRLQVVDAAHAVAELDMVHGKSTVLTGTRATHHGAIPFGGVLTGTEQVEAVVRFTVQHPEGKVVVHEADAGMQMLGGPCTGSARFDILLPTPTGIPAVGFAFPGFGDYSITMTLAEKGGAEAAGSAVVVSGHVKEVPPLRVAFFPAYYEGSRAEFLQSLSANVSRMASESEAYIPDYFPLAPGGVEATVRPIPIDLSLATSHGRAFCEEITRTTRVVRTPSWCYEEAAVLDATLMLRAASFAAKADRAIVVLGRDSYNVLESNQSVAFTPSTQVIFTRIDQDHTTVAHELVHSLPRHLWSGDEMNATCGVDYHNVGQYGSGVRVTLAGQQDHARFDNVTGIMGPATAGPVWMEQCTYWHLLTALETRIDPLVLEVRGFVARDDNLTAGGFAAGFLRDDVADITAGSTGDYALVFRDAAGTQLARYGFDVSFASSDGRVTHLADFGFRLPFHEGAKSLELAQGTEVLAQRDIPSQAPTVTIVAPEEGEAIGTGGVDVRWEAQGAGPLSSTLLVSQDEGGSWQVVALEVPGTNATIPAEFLSPGALHVVRVIVSDGVLSGEDDASFGRPMPDQEDGGIPGVSLVWLAVALAVAALATRKVRA